MERNWASVSPQKPTMTSVETVMPGTAVADAVEALPVVLDGVLAAHPAQHLVVARLDRQVEVLADARAVGQGRDEPVRKVPRMGGHEAQPRDGRQAVAGTQAVDRPDELGEIGAAVQVEPSTGPALRIDVREARLGLQVVAVRVHVLAQQRHLAVPGRGQRPRLVDDVVERAAALRARG